MKRNKNSLCSGFTMVELMFAVTIFSLVATAIYVTLITLSKRVESINVLTTATSKVALFEKEFGFIVMPSQTIEFRDGSGNPLNPASAPDSDRDEIFFNVLNSSLNWVWMRIWYDPSTSQIWLDPNISGGSTPVVLLKNVERFDYMSAALRGDDPLFTIKVALGGGDFYVSMNICYLMDSVSTIEKDPIRLRITKRKRN